MFGPDSDEGMKCSGGGQHELTGRRLQFVLFLPLVLKIQTCSIKNLNVRCVLSPCVDPFKAV